MSVHVLRGGDEDSVLVLGCRHTLTSLRPLASVLTDLGRPVGRADPERHTESQQETDCEGEVLPRALVEYNHGT